MAFRVVWSQAALAQFKSIYDYVARQSPSGAESVRSAILDHLDAIAQQPLMGAVYERDRTGQTREVVSGSYRIFYSVDEAAKLINVTLVWHSARSEPNFRR
jgi:plasmid stabilization system protein ParE